MRQTKRKPATVGEILKEEFLEPMEWSVDTLAKYSGLTESYIEDLISDKGIFVSTTAVCLSKALDTTPEFWLNIQYQTMLWEVNNHEQIANKTNHCSN